MKINDIIPESASAGSTGAGSIASTGDGLGGAINRRPSLFGYIPEPEPKKKKKKKKAKKIEAIKEATDRQWDAFDVNVYKHSNDIQVRTSNIPDINVPLESRKMGKEIEKHVERIAPLSQLDKTLQKKLYPIIWEFGESPGTKQLKNDLYDLFATTITLAESLTIEYKNNVINKIQNLAQDLESAETVEDIERILTKNGF